MRVDVAAEQMQENRGRAILPQIRTCDVRNAVGPPRAAKSQRSLADVFDIDQQRTLRPCDRDRKHGLADLRGVAPAERPDGSSTMRYPMYRDYLHR